ncbi:MAG: hypothetical protein LBT81_05035 [Helicobacteraceae bacterium]|jgi:hypothetical protein|nr:hypothetical protein [Helicobacteraceae bacterium]
MKKRPHFSVIVNRWKRRGSLISLLFELLADSEVERQTRARRPHCGAFNKTTRNYLAFRSFLVSGETIRRCKALENDDRKHSEISMASNDKAASFQIASFLAMPPRARPASFATTKRIPPQLRLRLQAIALHSDSSQRTGGYALLLRTAYRFAATRNDKTSARALQIHPAGL